MKEAKRAMSMLEYIKLLLQKVSFNQELVKKEYAKGIKFLNLKDQEELKKWLDLKGISVD